MSILVSWALEDAVTTADSMRARGYGQHRRSNFSIFRFGRRDAVMLAAIVLLFGAEIYTYASGRGTMTFYPTAVWPEINAANLMLYGAFFALGILPSLIQLKEDRKWKQLK